MTKPTEAKKLAEEIIFKERICVEQQGLKDAVVETCYCGGDNCIHRQTIKDIALAITKAREEGERIGGQKIVDAVRSKFKLFADVDAETQRPAFEMIEAAEQEQARLNEG